MKTPLTLQPGKMSLAEIRRIWAEAVPLALPPAAYEAINASAATVARIVERGDAAYGINTGFGKLAKTRIPDEQLELLQRNLILSHSVGTGDLIDDAAVRLILAMKIGSLARPAFSLRRAGKRKAGTDRRVAPEPPHGSTHCAVRAIAPAPPEAPAP